MGKGYIFSLSNVPRIRKVSKESAFAIRIKPLTIRLLYTLYISPYRILIYRRFDEMFVAIKERERGRHYMVTHVARLPSRSYDQAAM